MLNVSFLLDPNCLRSSKIKALDKRVCACPAVARRRRKRRPGVYPPITKPLFAKPRDSAHLIYGILSTLTGGAAVPRPNLTN